MAAVLQRSRTVVPLLAALAAPLAPAGLVSAAGPVVHHTLSFQGCAVHVLTVARGTPSVPVAARPGKTVAAFANRPGVTAAINGGYFNHADGWPVSHVLAAGQALTDPEHNLALKRNPVLAPLLPRILAHRAEWRHVTTAQGDAWRVAFHDEAPGPLESVPDALQAGPRLLPAMDLVGEGFVVLGAGGKVVRDGIGTGTRATRSAIGLKPDGAMLLVGVGMPGLSLKQLASLMTQLGARSALNLDGGSSTSLVWREGGQWTGFYGGHAPAPVNSALLVGAGS